MRIRRIWLSIAIIIVLGCEANAAKMLTITGEQLNVRAGPGRTYDVVEVVNKNEKFAILAEQEGWYKISVEGVSGWVLGKAATVTAAADLREMLQRADAYFARQQFTTPPDANAFDLYQEVLGKDPENAHARKKLAHMAKIYKNWADAAAQRGDYQTAKTFYQRYLFLAPDDPQVQQFLNQSQNPVFNPAAALPILHLRTAPATLSAEDVAQMLRKYGFHHPADWSKYGLSASLTGNMQHEYEVKAANGGPVIVDYATNSMWQPSGPKDPLPWRDAQEYIVRLNREQAAGYAGWRLPTLEELASLLEPARQKSQLFLAPVFGASHVWCWSADQAAAADKTAWYVSFSSGGIQQQGIANAAFVLAVRSMP